MKIEIWGCRLETRNGCLQSAVARRPRAEVSGWQNLGLGLYSPVSSLQSPVSILRIGNLGLGLYSPVSSLQSPVSILSSRAQGFSVIAGGSSIRPPVADRFLAPPFAVAGCSPAPWKSCVRHMNEARFLFFILRLVHLRNVQLCKAGLASGSE